MDVIEKEMSWKQVFWLLVRWCHQCTLVIGLCCKCLLQGRISTHRYFFLRYNNRTVLPPDCYWCEPTLVYGLESIFCKEETSHECEGINDKNVNRTTPTHSKNNSTPNLNQWLKMCLCLHVVFLMAHQEKFKFVCFDIYFYWANFVFFLNDFDQMASTNVTFMST